MNFTVRESLIFAFRPCLHPAALYRGSAESKKMKQVLCVLSVSAVKVNIKFAPF